MTAYGWAMRFGARILFLATLLIFVVSFANYFFVQGAMLAQNADSPAILQSKFVLLCVSVAEGLRNSVWPFFGACLLYRLDAHWGSAKGPRA
jgi:hypothetical protein